MMRVNRIVHLLGAVWLGLLIFSAGGCDLLGEEEDDDESLIDVSDNGYTQINQQAMDRAIDGLPEEDLSSEEIGSIRYIREEEKLARDVNTELDDEWDSPIFNNIAQSEETHMNAVELLIDKYELDDPIGDEDDVGTFANQQLQDVYNSFTDQARESQVAGLTVGATVQERSVASLRDNIDRVDNQDIERVYEHLLRGSRNHLRAFVNQLDLAGETYTPRYLSQSEYDEIVNSSIERGPVE